VKRPGEMERGGDEDKKREPDSNGRVSRTRAKQQKKQIDECEDKIKE
jgi:hypothetical protein